MDARKRYTAALVSTPDPWGGRTTVYAVKPHGLMDAVRVLAGRYDARVWIEGEKADPTPPPPPRGGAAKDPPGADPYAAPGLREVPTPDSERRVVSMPATGFALSVEPRDRLIAEAISAIVAPLLTAADWEPLVVERRDVERLRTALDEVPGADG